MPTPSRTSNAEVVAAARELLEAGGLEAVSMQAVAERVGVRAPSLYKRFESRAAVVRAIAADVVAEQERLYAEAVRGDDPAADIRRLADAYRAFARRRPQAYQLVFADLGPEASPSVEALARAAAPLVEVASRLVGPARALDAARLVTAFAHGFVSMELAGAFRLGGDVDEAYAYGVEMLIAALSVGPERVATSAPALRSTHVSKHQAAPAAGRGRDDR